MSTTLRKWFELKWSLWKFASLAAVNFLASVGCYGVGLMLLSREYPMALARAGALATCCAIVCTLWDYQKALFDSQTKAAASFFAVTKHLSLTGKEAQEDLERRLEANTRKVDLSVKAVNVGLLVIATLVWGFGDLAAPPPAAPPPCSCAGAQV